MAKAVCELFYYHGYDEEIEDLWHEYLECYADHDDPEDPDSYDLAFADLFHPEFEDFAADYVDRDFVLDNGLRVAFLLFDPASEQIEVNVLSPESPDAPAWYTAGVYASVLNQVTRLSHPNPDGTLFSYVPEDPAFATRRSLGWTLEEYDKVLRTKPQNHAPAYDAYVVEFRPNTKSQFAFPVAVLCLDQDGTVHSAGFEEHNPYAPASIGKKQRANIARRLETLLHSGELGGQFSVEPLPAVTAANPRHALDKAMAYLEEWAERNAS